MTLTISKSIYLNVPPEKVWPWLTQPEKLAVWFHKPKTPLQADAPYELFGVDSGNKVLWGDVLSAEEPNYLEMTFCAGPMGELVTNVKWWLEPVSGGTRLRLEHSGIPDTIEAFGLAMAFDKGWDDHISRMRTGVHESE
ncbi:MAG: SRPBCC domain-containing protein [Paracoccaceae bacterium]